MMKHLSLLAAFAIAAHAGTYEPLITPARPEAEPNPLSFLDLFRTSAYGNFGMEFDNSPGELDAYQVEVQSFLSKPLTFGNLSLLPTFRYEGTFLRYDDTPAFLKPQALA